MYRLLAATAMASMFCACSSDDAPEAATGCWWFQRCGTSADGAACGTCDDGDPCTEDRCIGGAVCGYVPLSDACACTASCDDADIRLQRVQWLHQGLGGVDGLRGLRDVLVTDDERHVYLAAAPGRGSPALGKGWESDEALGEGAVTLLVRAGDRLHAVEVTATGVASALAVSEAEDVVYVAGPGGLRAFGRDVETGRLSAADAFGPAAEGLAASGPWLAAADPGGTVRLYDQTGTGGVEVDSVGGAELKGVRRLAFSADGRSLYAAAFDASAVLSYDVQPDGRLVATGSVSGAPGLRNPDGLAVSPDGGHVYATGFCDHAIAILRRDPQSGALEHVGSAGAAGVAAGCPTSLATAIVDGEGDQLEHPTQLAVTPDGAEVVVASFFGELVFRFARSGDTLTLAGSVDLEPLYADFDQGSEGEDPLPTGWPQSMRAWAGVVAVGGRVYATSRMSNTLSVVEGTQVSQFVQQGDGGLVNLTGAYNLAISPDDRNVYVAGRNNEGVAVLARDPETGALRQLPTPEMPGLDEGALTNVTVSPDGHTVFAVDSMHGLLHAFDRADDGTLALVAASVLPPCGGDRPFPVGVTVSPDNTSVYVADFHVQPPSCVFRFDADGSALDGPVQTVQDASVHGAEDIVITADGAWLYVAAHWAGAITRYRRAADGALSEPDAVEHAQLHGAEVVALSPDERWVLASSPSSAAVVLLERDPVDGRLTVRDVASGEPLLLKEASGLAVAPGGDVVFAAARESAAVTVLRLGEAGTLTPIGTVQDHESLSWANGLVASHDGRNLYGAANRSSSLIGWRILRGHEDGCGGTCSGGF